MACKAQKLIGPQKYWGGITNDIKDNTRPIFFKLHSTEDSSTEDSHNDHTIAVVSASFLLST